MEKKKIHQRKFKKLLRVCYEMQEHCLDDLHDFKNYQYFLRMEVQLMAKIGKEYGWSDFKTEDKVAGWMRGDK